MNEFFPKQDIQLQLKIVEQGLVFLFHRSNGGSADTLQVERSHVVVQAGKSQRYCAKDQPLLVWKQGEELHVKFYSEDTWVAEECVFSGEETRRILTMLEELPSLN